MRRQRLLAALLVCFAVAGCSKAPDREAPAPELAKAEALVDAFYSFDQSRLRAAMSDAPGSMPDTLYYQGWAEGGHYRVLDRRPCKFDKPDEVACAITVKDDLIAALGTGYDVTDVFHMRVADGRIVKVWNSSNDPPEFEQAMDWLRKERPQIFTEPCRDMFKGGPTPGDCVRAVVEGFKHFRETKPPNA